MLVDAEDIKFIYLLNQMENAAQQDNPAKFNYGDKRKAVLSYVESLSAQVAELKKDAEELPRRIVASLAVCSRFSLDELEDGINLSSIQQCLSNMRLIRLLREAEKELRMITMEYKPTLRARILEAIDSAKEGKC